MAPASSRWLEGFSLVLKTCQNSNGRSVTPGDTLSKWLPAAPALGITRIAEITGLDFLGVPVFQAVRPNSKSLSVSQGKGLTKEAAMASALMEAAETAHAEVAMPGIGDVSASQLRKLGCTAVDEELPVLTSRKYMPSKEISWSRGFDIMQNRECWVPFELVHTDYTLPLPETAGYFPLSSSGLASGNHILEAVSASLFELIERDAMSLWPLRASAYRASRRLDPNSLEQGQCARLVEKLVRHGMSAALWNITTDIGIPCFMSRIGMQPEGSAEGIPSFYGSGCHLSKEVALLRSLLEAIQTRLTYVSGARDDLKRGAYVVQTSEALYIAALDAWESAQQSCSYASVKSQCNGSVNDDIACITDSFSQAGISSAIMVDLTNPELGLPVVRMIVPGLEFDHDDVNMAPGKRAVMVRAGKL